MVNFHQPLTPATQATESMVITCIVQDIDAIQNIAHVRDQLGNVRKVSLNNQPGKAVVFPQTGEKWLISREYGDWMFVVAQNTAQLGSVADTANTVVLRDSNGRSQVNTPAAGNDIANKSYVDASVPPGVVPAGGAAGALLHKNSATNYDTGWLASASGPTASTAMVRDANGRSQVADPSAAQDISSKNYTDTQDASTLSTAESYTNTQIAGVAAVPTGVLMPFAGSTAPSGYFLCNGQAVSRTTYSALYAVVGTTYGAGDGSTTFNLPNMSGRVGVGVGTATGANGATNHTLGQAAGEETHILTATEIPAHTHGVTNGIGGTTSSVGFRASGYQNSGTGTTTGVFNTDAGTGGGGAHNIMQPYLALNFIIKY